VSIRSYVLLCLDCERSWPVFGRKPNHCSYCGSVKIVDTGKGKG
jgi:rRNA maturation endonuclease Nob1